MDVTVHGDESRTHLARRVIENREAISAKAVRLLESFMRDHGSFDLTSIEVFATVTPKEGDFALGFSFIADRTLDEYNYTYFEVFFFCRRAAAGAVLAVQVHRRLPLIGSRGERSQGWTQ